MSRARRPAPLPRSDVPGDRRTEVPAGSDHLEVLDVLRGGAILAVFLFHCLGPAFGRAALPWHGWRPSLDVEPSFLLVLPVTLGWLGVAVFFVVSGFCIHLSYLRRPDWGEFFIRRAFRIYPAYVVALLFFALVFPVSRVNLGSFYGWALIGSHLSLTHNFHPRLAHEISSAFWSIAVECQLYAIYPLLLALVARAGWRRALLIVGAGEFAIRAAAAVAAERAPPGLPTWIVLSPFAFWFSWALGAALAERHFRAAPMSVPAWLVPTFAFLTLGSVTLRPPGTFTFLLGAACSAAWLSRRIVAPGFGTSRFLDHLRLAGRWSYSLYLIHHPILWAIQRLPLRFDPNATLPPLLLFAICAASWFAVLPLSGLFYHACEVPFIEAGKRLIARRRRARTA